MPAFDQHSKYCRYTLCISHVPDTQQLSMALNSGLHEQLVPPDHQPQVALACVDGVRHRQVVDHPLLPVFL